jgi:hypothetical protein
MQNAQNNEDKDLENSLVDDEHDDELVDSLNDMNWDDDDDGERLVPLGLWRSKSQQIGLTKSFKIKQKAPMMKKVESSNM